MSAWRKSSKSIQNPKQCVEVLLSVADVRVRDSKDRAAGHFAVTPGQWSAFVHALKGGRFEG